MEAKALAVAITLVAMGFAPGAAAQQDPVPEVAVLDSGIDADHAEFCDGQIVHWDDLVNDRSDPYDDEGHGTAVASRVAGASLGALPCGPLMIYKVLSSDDFALWSDVMTAIYDATDRGAEVISISLWSSSPQPWNHPAIADAIDYATDNGTLVVWIAGNGGEMPALVPAPLNRTPSPILADTLPGAGSPQVLLVGASTEDGERADFSQADPEVLAWGKDVPVAAMGGGTFEGWGTSFAAPWVAGAAAHLLVEGAPREPSWLKWVLLHSARDDPMTPYLEEGYGVLGDQELDDARAIARGEEPVPLPDHRDAPHLVSTGARTGLSATTPAGALPPGLIPDFVPSSS